MIFLTINILRGLSPLLQDPTANNVTASKNKAWNLLKGADELFKKGKFQEALESCNKALAIDPEDANAWNNRGNTLIKIAELALDELKELGPGLSFKYKEEIEKAKSALAQGRYDEAEKQSLRIREELEEAKKTVKQAREDMASALLALEKARSFGCYIPEELQQLLRKAEASFESWDFKQASLLAGMCQEKIKALKEDARPEITLSFSRTAFEPETWDDLVIRVVNKGKFHAEAVSLSIPRRAEVELLEELGLLRAGKEAELPLRFKPMERGKVPLNIEVSFRDL